MLKSKQIFYLIFIGLAIKSNAQSIKRSTICSFGNSSNISNQIFSQSVGQPSNTKTSSLTDLTLRQGFQQPLSQNENKIVIKNCDISVYPNPLKSDVVSIETHSTLNSELKISVFNAQGASVYSYNSLLVQSSINLSFLAPGTYTVFAENSINEMCSTKLIIVR